MGTLKEGMMPFVEGVAETLCAIDKLLATGASEVSDVPGTRRTLARYLVQLRRVNAVAETAKVFDLQCSCSRLEEFLIEIGQGARLLTAGEQKLIWNWPMLARQYLLDPEQAWITENALFNLSVESPFLPLPSAENPEDQHEVPCLATEYLGELSEENHEVKISYDISISSDFPLSQTVTEIEYSGEDSVKERDNFQSSAHEEEQPDIADYPMDVATSAPIQPASEASFGIQEVHKDFLDMLAVEIATNHESLSASLAIAMSIDAEPGVQYAALEDYCEQWSRMALAAESIGLTALADANRLLTSQLKAFFLPLTSEQSELLDSWSLNLQDYLALPQDPAICRSLVGVLESPLWPEAIATDKATALAEALAAVNFSTALPEAEIRPTIAQPEDVSIAVADDINPELLDGLLHELPIQTGALSASIERMAAGDASLKDVEQAQRAAHTLKGAANTVGIRGIANLTHHLEDILVALTKYETLPDRTLCAVLTNAVDCLESMSEMLLGVGAEPENSVEVLQEVLDWANRIDSPDSPLHQTGQHTDAKGSAETPAANRTQSSTTGLAHTDEGSNAAEESLPQSEYANVPMLRVPAPIIDEQLRLVGESIIANSQIQDRLQKSIAQSKHIKQHNQLLEKLVAELENLVDIRGIALPQHQNAQHNDEFDPLEFEHYSELHSVTRRLIEAATDAKEMSAQTDQYLTQFGDLLDAQRRLNLDSQKAVMRTRMVSVSSIVSRLKRSVRQTSRLLDKPVSLEVEGANTLIDSQVLNTLIDPLMHVLRNAVDHGIEDTASRTAREKNPEGKITLAFSHHGSHIVVRCRDDGMGLDLNAIRNSAIKKRLITADAILSDDEIAHLILTPGFSTRTETTQVSGRGIGMDVVANCVQELKGSINLHSMPGEGLTVELRLPATLLSTHALLIRVRAKVVAISTRGIEDIHFVTPEQVKTIGVIPTYHIGNTVYELTLLDVLLNLPHDRRRRERGGFPVLIVKTDTGAARAIQVQEILENRELIMKSLGQYVPHIPGVAGAAILGDGSVAPVLDLPELLRVPSDQTNANASALQSRDLLENTKPMAHRFALVVDDSLSARRATAQVMKDAGFIVRMAGDGLEAVSILDKLTPDIVLVDMEMPRMNGLELTSHIRAREQTKHVPVIMITSRSTEKHQRQAVAVGVNVYLTKPFNDELLLQNVTKLTERKQ